MAKSYDDPVKSESRTRLRKFIEKNLLPFARPRDIKVLCFPGAEQDGQEGLEIKEVYDPLKIPRKNIIGLETDQKRYERLMHAGLGITAVKQTDLEYLCTAEKPFHVISLDYTGPKGQELDQATSLIAARQLLTPLSILALNNYAMRESKTRREFIVYNMLITRNMAAPQEEEGYSSLRQLTTSISDITIDDVSTAGLATERDAFTLQVYANLMNGTGAVDSQRSRVAPFLLRHPRAEEVTASVLERITHEGITSKELIHHILFAAHFDALSKYLADTVPGFQKLAPAQREIEGRSLARLFFTTEVDAYLPKNIERYKYRSNSGGNMELDLFAIATLRRYKPLLGDITHDSTILSFLDDEEALQRHGRNRIKQIVTKLQRAQHELSVCHISQDSLPVREDLGSSYVPPLRKQQLSRAEAIELLRGEIPITEILECYKGFTAGQLAAFKAHITMGTYAKKIN